MSYQKIQPAYGMFVSEVFASNTGGPEKVFLSHDQVIEHFVSLMAAEAYTLDQFDSTEAAEADPALREDAETYAAEYEKESTVVEQWGDVVDYRNTSAQNCNCADIEIRYDGYYVVTYGRFEGLESPGSDIGPFASLEEARPYAEAFVN